MAVPERRRQPGLRGFLANRQALVGLTLLLFLAIIALVGPLIWHFGYREVTPELSAPPSLPHPFGTDSLGRDMLALVMRGLQQSLLIALTVAAIGSVIGTLLGVIAGTFGGLTDAAIMRLVDLMLTIPTLAVAAFLGNRLSKTGVAWFGLSLVLGCLFWTPVARLVRGVSLGLRDLPFIKAARVMGAGSGRIIVRHMLPNVADHAIVATALLVGVAILTETGLSFLGFGVRPPDTSLGLLIASAQSAVLTRPWMFYIPGVGIILVVLSVNYIGEGLRDAVNPKATVINPLVPARLMRERHPAADPAALDHLLSVAGLTVTFAGAPTPSVDKVHLHLKRGEVLALVGESGSGKSLTSLAIAGLLPVGAVAEGSIAIDGHPVGQLSFAGWRAYRGRRIATILQDPSTSLNPVMTIGAQFAESFRIAGAMPMSEVRRRAIDLMTLLAIRDPESKLGYYPHQLSGGMRQRIVIAMAMIHNPDLIIADEPTTALDVTVQAQVLAALRVAREKTGAAMLFITHDLALVAGIADRVAVMRAGRIIEEQDVFSLFAAPRDPYTARLLSLAPRLGGAMPTPRTVQPRAALLRVEALSTYFVNRDARGKGTRLRALNEVTFDLAAGETLGIVGESGSGKTTLLATILGLQQPTAGRVLFDGTLLTNATRKAVSRHIGVVFQDPYSSLDPRMTVAEILEEPIRIHGVRSEAKGRAARMLDRVGLAQASLGRFAHEFSGGQRQRIAIARALMLDPKLVVMDEPVSALDVSIQQDILRLLGELKRDGDVAYVIVAHDIAIIAALSDRIGVMQNGCLVELGPAGRIVTAPQHPYSRALLDAVPIPDPIMERARLAKSPAEALFGRL